MSNPTRKTIANQIIRQKKSLENSQFIKLNSILGSQQYLNIIGQCREYRERIFTPFITIMVFIKQVLDPDRSCKKAVSMFIAERLSENQEPCSQNTGPYCKARQRLPESTVKRLVDEIGNEAKKQSSRSWKWKGRNVNVVDGTTLLMPETQSNQAEYPKHKNQIEGISFPIMRLLVIFSLATGVVLDYAMAPIRGLGTGEPSMLRRILGKVMERGDILLGDCGFHSFYLLVDLIEKGCDGLFQASHSWKIDFRRGKKLAKNDYIILWKKPKRKTKQMDLETYHKYPKFLQIRVFKVGGKAYITTLLDPKKYHKNELGELYRFRWQAELHLRSIKSIMGMRMLSCKTPSMIRKEVGIHFLAYNIIRILIAESAGMYGVLPLQISFKNTVQFVNSFIPPLIYLDKETSIKMYQHMLQYISGVIVGNRPGRIEPKAVKIRTSQFPLLKVTRIEYRNKFIKQKHAA